jgi:hypothetical protein
MIEAIHTPGQVTERVRSLGDIGAIVIGSTNLYVAFDGNTRAPIDIDIAVDEDVFRSLYNQSEKWQMRRMPSSDKPRIVRDGLDIGIGWEGIPYDTLSEQAWELDGVRFAHLADVYAWKQRRNLTTKDSTDLHRVRELVHGENSRPLPAWLTTHEQSLIWSFLPDDIGDGPEVQQAVELAASGLCGVRTIYGDMKRGQVNHIIGEKEKPSYGMLAAYHEGGIHTPNGMRWLMRHMSIVNAADRRAERPATFDRADFLDGLIAYAYHDAIFGNGRGVDEIRSAQLAQMHAAIVGYTQGNTPTNLFNGIKGTIYDHKAGTQSGVRDLTPLVRGMCGVDEQGMSEAGEVERAYHITAENSLSGQLEPTTYRVIGKAALAHGLRIFSPQELYEFIDKDPDETPVPGGPTLAQAALKEMARDAAFISPRGRRSYHYPVDWTGQDSDIRKAHAEELRAHIRAISRGRMTFSEGYQAAMLHTARMQERYPNLALVA